MDNHEHKYPEQMLTPHNQMDHKEIKDDQELNRALGYLFSMLLGISAYLGFTWAHDSIGKVLQVLVGVGIGVLTRKGSKRNVYAIVCVLMGVSILLGLNHYRLYAIENIHVEPHISLKTNTESELSMIVRDLDIKYLSFEVRDKEIAEIKNKALVAKKSGETKMLVRDNFGHSTLIPITIEESGSPYIHVFGTDQIETGEIIVLDISLSNMEPDMMASLNGIKPLIKVIEGEELVRINDRHIEGVSPGKVRLEVSMEGYESVEYSLEVVHTKHILSLTLPYENALIQFYDTYSSARLSQPRLVSVSVNANVSEHDSILCSVDEKPVELYTLGQSLFLDVYVEYSVRVACTDSKGSAAYLIIDTGERM